MTVKELSNVISVYSKLLDSGNITASDAVALMKEQGVSVTKNNYKKLTEDEKQFLNKLGLVPTIKPSGKRGRRSALEKIREVYPQDAVLIEEFKNAVCTRIFTINKDGADEKYVVNPPFFRRIDENAPKRTTEKKVVNI